MTTPTTATAVALGDDRRTGTAMRFPVQLHDQLRQTAQRYGWSVNWIVNRAVVEFLADLLPPDEIVLTRRRGDAGS